MPAPTTILSAAIAAFLFLPARIVAAAPPSIARHDLAVVLHPRQGTLSGTDALSLLPGGAPSITLFLASGARVRQVSASGQPVPFEHRTGTLTVSVPEATRAGEWQLTVAYEATFDDPVPEDPVNTEDLGYGVVGAISPRGVFLSEEAGWYPGIPGSSPTWKVRIEANDGFEGVTAGTLVRRSASGGATVTEWTIDHPLPGIALSAGVYRVREKNADGIKLYTYFFPETDPFAEKYLDAASRYLDLYRNLFGPYPFGKFAVVENFFPTGYGFPSYTLLGSTVLRLPFIPETSLGHEIAHSWWGNGVRADLDGGNWSEGLATYVADHLYKDRSSPAEGREYRLQILRDYATLVSSELDFPLTEFTGRVNPASRAVGYGKAAMVFHMARRQAGDEAFWSGLRGVVREKLFRTASWEDFDRAFFGVRSGGPSPFVRQWVDRPGAPVLALKNVKTERDGARWKVTGHLVQKKPYYALRVPLRVETAGTPANATVAIEGEDVQFELFADFRPARLVVDPDVDLFRRLDPSEIPPIVNSVRGSETLLVMAARGLPPEVLEASRILLAALGKKNLGIAREEDTPASALAGRDVLYLGLPQGREYLPSLPRELSAAPDRFTLEGATYASARDALFAVLPHPSDKGRVAAVFLPLSAEAAAQAARKIPHYGKYSFLSFSAGTNRAKGTWAVRASPTVHEFPPAP